MLETVKTAAILASVDNPFDGVSPSLDVFGKEFDSKTTLILGGVWAIAILACGFALLKNGGKWGFARKRGQIGDGEEAASDFWTSGWATAAGGGVPLRGGAIVGIMRERT